MDGDASFTDVLEQFSRQSHLQDVQLLPLSQSGQAVLLRATYNMQQVVVKVFCRDTAETNLRAFANEVSAVQ